MSSKISCRYCEEEFIPSVAKAGYYDVCPRCTAQQLQDKPELEPEPLRAGLSIDESGTFEEIAPASRLVNKLPGWHWLSKGRTDSHDTDNLRTKN